jgi:hypothetical protein
LIATLAKESAMAIIDTPWNTTAKLTSLAASGVTTIFRYYNYSNSQRLPEKCLTLAEAQAISAQGISIGVVFQQGQNGPSDFTEIKGYEAGRRAYRYAQNDIGQPSGSGIYFSVDFDASASEIKNFVTPFFKGIQRAFNEVSGSQPIYRVGVYGSGATATALTKAKLCDLVWLAMSRGFRGTRDALSKGNYNLEQRAPEAVLCGLGVDYDYANPANPDCGAFVLPTETNGPATNPQAIACKVIARNGLFLREGPGKDFDKVGSLQSGSVVYAQPVNAEWSSVDVEGDGLLDGFAASAYLKPINQY